MIYIRPEDRANVDHAMLKIMHFVENHQANQSELAYMFTELAKQFVKAKGTNSRTLNDVLGVFSQVHAEFYRRVVVPFQEQQRADHGDVF